eukprot:5520641-Amphidinium_carterae.1
MAVVSNRQDTNPFCELCQASAPLIETGLVGLPVLIHHLILAAQRVRGHACHAQELSRIC